MPPTALTHAEPIPEGTDNQSHVIDFNDCVKYPLLYDVRQRYDEQHLNKAGAEVFTRLLASEIAGLYGNLQLHH